MAFDGFVISNLVYELNNTILNTKISKIAQPETDELLFTLKGSNGQYRLAMSASASLPFLYLTGSAKLRSQQAELDRLREQTASTRSPAASMA